MKITANDLFSAHQTAKALSAEKLPVKGKYWVGRLIDQLQTEFNRLGAERDDLLRKYGKVQEDGTVVITENKEAFLKDMKELMDTEVEIPDFTFKLSILGDGEVATDLSAIARFITEE